MFEGLGCKALRVTEWEKIEAALRRARQMAQQCRVPVVVECVLEKVTNIAVGTEIDNIDQCEAIDRRHAEGRKGPKLAALLG